MRTLKFLRILSEKKEKKRLGTYTYIRLNPFNPVTYLYIIIMFVTTIVLHGVYGVLKFKKDIRKAFKWS